MVRSLSPVSAAALLAACASAPEIPDSFPTIAAAPAPMAPRPVTETPLPQGKVDPAAFAVQYPTAADCEQAARALRRRSPSGWDALRGCVERHWNRGDFTTIEWLLTDTWIEDLRTRPDAPIVLARLVAQRGGDVEGDLSQLQKRRVPLFSLASALAQPQTYTGRLLIVRARLKDFRGQNGQQALVAYEYTLRPVDTGTRYSSSSSYGSSYSSGSSTSGSYNGGYTSSWTHDYRTSKVAENDSQPTGRLAVGKLAKDDPFLERNKDFIFLVRFEGIRTGGEDERPYGMVTVLQYFAPNALVID